ncbi:hypothetical protein JW890_06360 [candidate division WOR-3 bacterium]|nr:hypothetical protein [candidate division WOR-3 bacterium]
MKDIKRKAKELSLKNKLFFFALLFLMAALSYSPSFFNKLCYDDVDLIIRNPHVQNRDFAEIFGNDLFHITRGESPYYRPLIPALFALEVMLWKDNWAMFHLDNFLFHLVTVILLYKLVKRIFQNSRHRKGIFEIDRETAQNPRKLFFWAMASSAFFAFHPANSQTVYWLSARGDLFVTIGILSGCLAIGLKKPYSFAVTTIAFAFVMLCKETGLLFLPIVSVYYFLFLRKQISLKKALTHAALFIPVILVYIFVRINVISVSPFTPVDESFWTQKDGLMTLYLTIPSIWGYYLLRTVFPFFLNFETGINLFYSFLDLQTILGFAAVSVTITAFYIFRNSKLFLWAFLVFLICLLPVLNFIPAFESGMEHYLYLPLTGASVLIPFLFLRRKALTAIFLILLLSFCAAVFFRGKAWKDNVSLFSDSAAKTGEKCRQGWIRSRNNLGTAYINLAIEGIEEEENLKKADSLYSLILDRFPNYGGAYIGKGDVFFISEEYLKALENYSAALKIYPSNYFLMNKLGVTYSLIDSFTGAKAMFIKAMEINSDYYDAAVNLSKVYFIEGNYDKASVLISGARETPSTSLLIKALKISIEAERGRIPEGGSRDEIVTAIEILDEAKLFREKLMLAEYLFERFPSDSDALYNAAIGCLSDLGDIERGHSKLMEGTQMFPGDARFLREIAVYHILAGDSQNAAYYFGKVLQLDPSHPEAGRMRDFIKSYSRR